MGRPPDSVSVGLEGAQESSFIKNSLKLLIFTERERRILRERRERKEWGRREGEKKRDGGRHQHVVLLIYAFLGCFLFVP